jgi:hypothetical protein
MGRPRSKSVKEGELVNVAFKLEGAVVNQLDAEADRLAAERPGLVVTRTDVVRIALHEWLAQRPKSRK